jgi:uncharacterized membrane protein
MNALERNLIHDTVLGGGLVLAVLVWVGMAAIGGPLQEDVPAAGRGAVAAVAPPVRASLVSSPAPAHRRLQRV